MDTTKLNEKDGLLKNVIKEALSELPANLNAVQTEIAKHLETALANCLNRLNIVTKEEFDAYVKVLQRLQEKVETLEKVIDTLENGSIKDV